ncbi:metal binding domain of Ada-domain-containing protein [Xylaria cf. heliscus]|nr:metal binding domain of Ada-domain-containing protein [Xylaria cf. heliscus]
MPHNVNRTSAAQRNRVAIPRDKRAKPAHSTTSSSSSTEEARWRLVLAHTPTTEFLYGVLSTGIYCRTSCPSRRPRRSNVRFFETPASAVAAGFRACRRCKPESTDSSHESPQAAAEKQVAIACEYVRQRKGEVQLSGIAAHVGLSPRYFHGLFKQVMGLTPGAYTAAVKRESNEQGSAPETPVASISDYGPQVLDFSNVTDLVDPAPIDNSAGGMSFVDLDQTAYNWFPEALEGLDCVNFDQGPISELINNFDLDMARLSQTNGESIEAPIDICTLDYLDPFLLDPWTAPS